MHLRRYTIWHVLCFMSTHVNAARRGQVWYRLSWLEDEIDDERDKRRFIEPGCNERGVFIVLILRIPCAARIDASFWSIAPLFTMKPTSFYRCPWDFEPLRAPYAYQEVYSSKASMFRAVRTPHLEAVEIIPCKSRQSRTLSSSSILVVFLILALLVTQWSGTLAPRPGRSSVTSGINIPNIYWVIDTVLADRALFERVKRRGPPQMVHRSLGYVHRVLRSSRGISFNDRGPSVPREYTKIHDTHGFPS